MQANFKKHKNVHQEKTQEIKENQNTRIQKQDENKRRKKNIG